MGKKLGKNCKSYLLATPITSTTYSTALSAAVEVTEIRNLEVNSALKTTDGSTRGSGDYDVEVITGKTLSISFQIVAKDSDAQWEILETAHNTSVPVAWASLTGAKTVTGSAGPAGNFIVKTLKRNESLPDVLLYDVELAPDSYVTWWEVTGS